MTSGIDTTSYQDTHGIQVSVGYTGSGITEEPFIPFRVDRHQEDMSERRLYIVERGQERVRRLHDLVVVILVSACFVSYLIAFLVFAKAIYS